MIFDEHYYSRIWGTVHRHDYCEGLAQNLISRFGKARILDIGTGCGFLVSKLRELGCDAWGIDISDYAVSNSCAPGFVLNASALGIPFRDGRFDVVHSQGLLEYISEDKIDLAFSECRRVGLHQLHTADHFGSEVDEENFATRKPIEWWNKKLEQPKILISCPIHERKEYAFQRWIDNVKAFAYPHTEILVMDTTEHAGFYARYSDRVPIKRLGGGWGWRHVARAMNAIREHFLGGNFSYWFNVESDILPPRDAIEILLSRGKGLDWISHCFPRRIGDHSKDFDQGIGCSMLSRRLMENFSWPDTEDTPDCALWEQVRPLNKFSVVELWGLFQCQHLTE